MYTSCIMFTYIYNVNNINTMCIIYNMYIYVYIYINIYTYHPLHKKNPPTSGYHVFACCLNYSMCVSSLVPQWQVVKIYDHIKPLGC